jgi:3-dehydrosphinganine reductase
VKEISGGHAIVTGGSSGIGLAVARDLGRRGVKLTLLARGRQRLDSAAAELSAAGCQVGTASVDVADQTAVDQAIQSAVAARGPCDYLVASAGLTQPGYFERLPIEVFRDLMEVNYFGVLHSIRAVLPSMIERRRGSVVGVSSTVGLIGVFGYGAYGPTKFAVRGLLECLRSEATPYGVHVGCAFPPDTETPQLAFEEPLKPEETKAISGAIKPISPERVAAAIVRGIEHERFWITADVQTNLLARGGSLVRGFLASDFDRKVRRVRAHQKAALAR